MTNDLLDEAAKKKKKKAPAKQRKGTTMTGQPASPVLVYQDGTNNLTNSQASGFAARTLAVENAVDIIIPKRTYAIQAVLNEYIDWTKPPEEQGRIPSADDRETGAPLDGVDVGTDSMRASQEFQNLMDKKNQLRRSKAFKRYAYNIDGLLGSDEVTPF